MSSIPNGLINILKDLEEIVSIDSSLGVAEKGKPYGEGPYKALEWALKKGEKYGCKTANLDGYCGYIEIGEGEELIGILGHLDVVPAGEGWNMNPFEMTLKDDGRIYGRGVLDDKGPVVVILHLMKEMLNSDRPINKRIRLILGTNEENVWDDIEYYKSHAEIPDISFTPDGDFPVIFAEKGILDISIKGNLTSEDRKLSVTALDGGTSRNSVADICTIRLSGSAEDLNAVADEVVRIADGLKRNISTEREDNVLKIVAIGKSVHCQHPEEGINAISHLMDILEVAIRNVNLSVPEFITKYNALIGITYNGEKVGCDMSDEVSGKLAFNVGKVRLEDDFAIFEISIRYPVTTKYEEIKTKLSVKLKEEGLTLQEDDHVDPIYFDTNLDFIKIFMDCYSESTGDFESKPVMVGGGSYARTLSNCVAFGPAMPGAEDVAHQPDEYVKLSDMVKWKEIYQNSLEKLLQINLKKVGK